MLIREAKLFKNRLKKKGDKVDNGWLFRIVPRLNFENFKDLVSLKYDKFELEKMTKEEYDFLLLCLHGGTLRLLGINWTQYYKIYKCLKTEDYVIEFNAEFFTSESGGFPAVKQEADLYQSLIKYQPTQDDNITDNEEKTDKYNYR